MSAASDKINADLNGTVRRWIDGRWQDVPATEAARAQAAADAHIAAMVTEEMNRSSQPGRRNDVRMDALELKLDERINELESRLAEIEDVLGHPRLMVSFTPEGQLASVTPVVRSRDAIQEQLDELAAAVARLGIQLTEFHEQERDQCRRLQDLETSLAVRGGLLP